MLHSRRRVSPISRFAANVTPIGTPIPVPGQIGNRGFPVSRFRPNRESGTPTPIPGHWQIGNRGNGNWGFPGLPQAQSVDPARGPLAPTAHWHRDSTGIPDGLNTKVY
jgi:hypothetical protein